MNTNTNAIGMSFKKKALIALCALAAVVAIVITTITATVAYLTASASVMNSFTVGNVAIKLDEAMVDTKGNYITDANNRGYGNTYELVPDRKYTKDPTLHVLDGSTPSYLFITIRNDLAPIANKDPNDDIKTIAEQLKENGWAEYKTIDIGTVYVYVGANIANLAGGKVTADTGVATENVAGAELSTVRSYKLFDYFSIDEDVKQEALTHYAAAKIIINAFAIQADGFNTVGKAWETIERDYSDVIAGLGHNSSVTPPATGEGEDDTTGGENGGQTDPEQGSDNTES